MLQLSENLYAQNDLQPSTYRVRVLVHVRRAHTKGRDFELSSDCMSSGKEFPVKNSERT